LYEKSADQHDAVGAGHYAFCLHFGTGICEDLDSAADFYEFVEAKQPSFLTENLDRCHRILNRRTLFHAAVKAEPAASVPDSGLSADILYWIHHYRVQPISWEREMPLGLGAFGSVIGAADPLEHRVTGEARLVVKRLSPAGTTWEHFMREVEILIRVRHPCVIPFVGWSISESKEYEIQMKRAENGDLQKWFDGILPGPRLVDWSATRKAMIICEIVLGMRYIHSQEIMHRDLKLANILLDPDWHAMICDFGISRFSVGEGEPTGNIGTKLYAAPEQFQSGIPYTKAVDIYSFGLIVSAIVESRTDFDKFHSATKPVLSPAFGPLLQELIPRCCSSQPSSRPSFNAIFAAFRESGYAILPGVDSKTIEQSVSRLLELETILSRGRREIRPHEVSRL
jgi:serine/threonine protein kinase